PIIGRPRPLPRQRRADPPYTLNCEEPVKLAKPEPREKWIGFHSDKRRAIKFLSRVAVYVLGLARHQVEVNSFTEV
ncbi:hypothetical protein, partial [Mycobacterium canetti]|uniref:hypothetical protein n=1 Tax=Mycobacterium canetti TaxID=78331 RepID=UPI00399D5B94